LKTKDQHELDDHSGKTLSKYTKADNLIPVISLLSRDNKESERKKKKYAGYKMLGSSSF
jgi:hypothetical protein